MKFDFTILVTVTWVALLMQNPNDLGAEEKPRATKTKKVKVLRIPESGKVERVTRQEKDGIWRTRTVGEILIDTPADVDLIYECFERAEHLGTTLEARYQTTHTISLNEGWCYDQKRGTLFQKTKFVSEVYRIRDVDKARFEAALQMSSVDEEDGR